MEHIINFFHIANNDYNSWQFTVAVFGFLIIGNILILTSKYFQNIFHRYLSLSLGNLSWMYGCILLLLTVTESVNSIPQSVDANVKGISGIIPILFGAIIILITFKVNAHAIPNQLNSKESKVSTTKSKEGEEKKR